MTENVKKRQNSERKRRSSLKRIKTGRIFPEGDMMEKSKKLHFHVRLAGWLGVLPSALTLYIYQNISEPIYLFLCIVTVALSLYMILTGGSPSWENRGKLWLFIVILILFSGLLPAIPLMIALKYAPKNS